MRIRTGIEPCRRAGPIVGALMAVLATSLGPVEPAAAVTPGQNYRLAREFKVDTLTADLAVNSATGDVYVTDRSTVKRYSASGALLGSVDLERPDAVDVSPSGDVYVADYFQLTVLRPDLTDPRFARTKVPLDDVATNPVNGEIYVTAPNEGVVVRLSPNGPVQWGSRGSAEGQLSGPLAIAVSPAGDVYVGDRFNRRISRFGPSGEFRATWGQLGTENGRFQWPAGLATDAEGNVYVAERADSSASGGRIQVFSADGSFITNLGAYGSVLSELPPFKSAVRDVDVDAAGRLHVVTRSEAGQVVQTWAPVAPGAPGKGKVTVVKPKGAAKLRGNRVRITAKCTTQRDCTGVASMALNGEAISRTTRYAVKAGTTKTITIALTNRGRKVLREETRRVEKRIILTVVTVGGRPERIKIRR